MSGFDAGAVVEPLNYNFATIAERVADPARRTVLEQARGTVPEPGQDQLDRFFRDLGKVLGVEPGDDSTAAVVKRLASMTEEQAQERADILQSALADLCAGSPSGEQIEALPARAWQAFLGWLIGELAPKGGRNAGSTTTTSVPAAPSVPSST